MDSCDAPPNRRETDSGIGGTNSSSSSISKIDYEVFLSFRGPDTRQGFTDFLYNLLIHAGIRVFRDEDELPAGNKIDEILTALNNSKICIVVLSPTFADSSWCLREVERMVEENKDIVPIFYHVTPDDVKLRSELYANALTKHETKHGKEKVQKWRDALKQIPEIKGYELKSTGYFDFINQITKEMLTKLKVKHKYEIKNLVQAPDEVEAALKLLDIESKHERRFLGIQGMGGIGKTTLVKVIYNQICNEFDCSCFLENIRESYQGPDGLHKLQEQLLKSLGQSMPVSTQIVDPMKMIKTNFRRKKVVIVLDDVDQKIHLDNLVGDPSWFGEGSRIIFTTRNPQLHTQMTSSDAHFYSLEKKEMDSEQALTLFSRHAFGKDSPPIDFESLSTKAINTMGGLPLALEVVGSLLNHKKAKVWREVIEKLEQAPHQSVQETLKISYDALEDEHQEIFLDIACFFIGEKKKNAVYMWEACGFSPNSGIDMLISMSLIKLEYTFFRMHDQLRDLGRAIVNVDSKDVRRAGSRLWRHTDAVDLLKTNVGREKAEALSLIKVPSPGCLGRGNFVGFKKLRFLKLEQCAGFGGDFVSLLPNLRWFTLRDASSFKPTNLCLTKLVVLELFKCRFDDKWPCWGKILISKQLKVLTLSDCDKLISTPDLSEVVNLERLLLHRCDKLTSIHRSIGKLQNLTHLSITYCESFHELPEQLTLLESLEEIVIQCGLSLSKKINLPESIGCLVSLKRLEVDGATNIPNSIGQLEKLQILSLKGSINIRVVPDSIGDLRSLIRLNLEGSGITELPSTIGRLAKLKCLNLDACWELQRLPDSIMNLHSLTNLNVRNCSFVWKDELHSPRLGFPSLEFCQLPSSLVSLALHVNKWGQLPSNISSMKNLRELDLANFIIDEADWAHGLKSLVDLNMKTCCLMFNEFHVVKKMRRVHLDKCQVEDYGFFIVVSSEGLESSLEVLSIHGCNITCLDLTQLNHLDSLYISDCEDLVDIQGIGKLKSRTSLSIHKCGLRRIEDLSELNGLSSVDIHGCKEFEGIDNIDRLLSAGTLSELYIKRCKCNDVHYLSNSSKQSMTIISTAESLSMDQWSAMQQLKTLRLSCPLLESGQCQLPSNIESLDLQLKRWAQLPSNLSSMKNLRELKLAKFVIEEGDFVKGLECLEVVEMTGCLMFNEFHAVRTLRELKLDRCQIKDNGLFKVVVPEGLELSLKALCIQDCIITCLDITQLNHVECLYISDCEDLVDIQGIGKLKSLTTLTIYNCGSLRRIEDLSELNGLPSVDIYECKKFEGIDNIDKLLSANTLCRLLIMGCKCNNVLYILDKKISPRKLIEEEHRDTMGSCECEVPHMDSYKGSIYSEVICESIRLFS